ncbi:hypothetical protein [Mycoplasma hafezii]|uniref:hypothetical protein n=1 Tax=Mycoplasma hafezii TaxID=525886 RepID=UPI003CF09F70
MLSKLKEKMRFEFKSKRFYTIVCSFALFWLVLFLLIYFLGYKNYINVKVSQRLLDSFSVSSLIVFLIDLLILVFKWGFLRHTINKTKETLDTNKKFRNERKMKKMTPEEKRVFLRMEEQKAEKQKNKPIKSNFGFYFVLLISFIITLPLIIVSICFYVK